MKTRYNLKMDTIDSLKDWLNENQDTTSEDDVSDALYEIVDQNIPIYHSDLLDVVGSSLRLWCSTSEICIPNEDSTPFSLIRANIYEALLEYIQERYHEKHKTT